MKNKSISFSSGSVNKPSAVGILVILIVQKVFKESSALLTKLPTEGYKIYVTAKEKIDKAVIKTYK